MKVYVFLAFFLVGCFPNVTTTKISRLPDGSIKIDSGKDVKIGMLDFREGEANLHVENYSSNANATVIEAQSLREINQFSGINMLIQTTVSAAVSAAMKGAVPIP